MASRASRLTALLRTARIVAPFFVVATCTEPPSSPQVAAPPPSAGGAAVGAGDVVLIGAGNIARCDRNVDEQTAQLLAGTTGTVFTLGDNTYGGTLADYQNCYGPSWGQYLSLTRPSPGEDDWPTGGPTGYFGYFGAAAGDPTKGYYSYDLGATWHIVVLNSSISMTATSPQVTWLKGDLAANTRSCVLAYWHFPRYSAYGGSTRGDVKPLWDALYAAGADVVVNGHFRFYERYAPQTPAGVLDDANGLREFIAGTGGMGEDGITGITPLPNSRIVIGGVDGVLKFTLHDGSYDWQFISLPSQNRSDAGSAACHHSGVPQPNQAPVANPGGPYVTEGTVAFDGTRSRDDDGNLPLTYAWNFGDGTTGTGATPTKSYVADGSYTVSLVVTDALGLASAPATTTVTVGNIVPVVSAGPDATVQLGSALTLAASFTDPGGVADSPWPWTVSWGDGTTTTGSAASSGSAIAPSHVYAAYGTFTVRVTVTDKDGAAGFDELIVRVPDPTSSVTLVGAGDIAVCYLDSDEATAKLLDSIPGTVFTLGDNAYEYATAADYANCYEPTWGRHKARTRPVAGNHEYAQPGAGPYFDYFGAAAGDRDKGYYSYELGDWLVIVLNDGNSSTLRTATSAQVQWLRATLAASTKLCTVAMMHEPEFTSREGAVTGEWGTRPIWDVIYEYGVELMLNGHDHLYERYNPMKPDGTPDPEFGVRQIIAGTGGYTLYNFGTIHPQSVVRNNTTHGVLKLTLHATSYDWEFVPIRGETFRDSGTAACHGKPGTPPPVNQAPVARAGGPYAADNTIAFDGTTSSDPDGNLPLSYAWNFGDGTTGTGATPTHNYAADGAYTATLVVTDALGLASAAAAATVTIANVAPAVNAGADATVHAGASLPLSASFTDLGGASDAPWSWTIDWGDGSAVESGSTSTPGGPIGSSHVYDAAGSFTARVTVTDKDGGSGSDDRLVTVTPPNRAPVAVPGGPYTSQGAITFDGSASSDPDGDALTYAWDFGDGTTGTGVRPTKSYAATGTFTVTLVVTDAGGLASAPATTTATVTNVAPTVNAGLDGLRRVGDSWTATATFTDPGGAADSPWSWTIDWGDGTAPSSGTAGTSGSSFSATHSWAAPGAYTVRVSVADNRGAVGSDDAAVRVGADVLIGAGSIARCDKTFDEQTAPLLGQVSGTVMSLGDAIATRSASDWTNCYGPTWGTYRTRTRPAPGENEYLASTNYYAYFGTAAGDPAKGYYSYDLGSSWHIVVLNSSIAMALGSAQETWLKADLAANTRQCILAYWHFPRFSAYNGTVRADVKPLWDDLYAAGADVVVNGHGLLYERYAQQTPTEVADPVKGIREFIAATGGAGLASPSVIAPRVNSQVRIINSYGVLALALDAGSYSWQFVPIAGSTATDSGTTACH